VAATEIDSHELAHSLEAGGAAGGAAGGGGAGGGGPAARDAAAPTGDVIDLTLTDDDVDAQQEEAHAKRQRTERSDGEQPVAGGGSGLLWPRIPLSELHFRQRAEGGDEQADFHALLRRALASQAASRGPAAAFRAALCGAPLLHFATREGHDGGFGCGWRNLQMLCGSLLAQPGPQLATRRAALFAGAGFVPDVPACQAWLEAAWAAGFDPAGREQLGGRVQGLPHWVGAVDCCALLRSFGLKAQIVDFKAPPAEPRPGPGGEARHAGVECDGCHAFPILGARFSSETRRNYDLCGRCAAAPEAGAHGPFRRVERPVHYEDAEGEEGACDERAHAPLVEFIWAYFSSDAGGAPIPATLGTQVCVSPSRPPLFLQHDGHSRTVVGVERRRRPAGASGEDVSLLIFDPSTPGAALSGALGQGQAGGWQRLVKRGLHTLRKREYSLLIVQPGMVERGGGAWEASKTIGAMEPATALRRTG